MRASLKKLLSDTIIYRYSLPNEKANLESINISTLSDDTYECISDSQLSDIIYNSIIDYSFNTFDMNNTSLEHLLSIALKTKIKYEESQQEDTKIKYGFYGEVLLYLLLYCRYDAKPLISRGYFYNPLENSETKGYDSYHLVENDGCIELWFGEVKFRSSLSQCSESAISGLAKAFSDKYLEKNILAMVNHQNNFELKGSKIEDVINSWMTLPDIKIIDEIKKYNMKLVYPIFFIYPESSDSFEDKIRNSVKHINEKYTSIENGLSIELDFFFVLLPVGDVKKIKEDVIKWIELKKPLIL
ncbi:TPA: DUF1837 domain-containing protein [Providencia rettgeri]|uniref:Hachiman antiphage defense system protein HamA n=1 Tax=Providencia sp. PROV129 TaxID=2949839 RepID=UPI00234AB5B9|nr:Hachiman antiphage defense system protein HamA [Providencia sp. PROV129]HEC8326891.1 DUF1837 domain-containing protein [Providencia rettgeri]